MTQDLDSKIRALQTALTELARHDHDEDGVRLRRNSLHMTTLLSVPDSEAVQRLIADNGWALSPNADA